jgi:hypothetical protein
MDVITFSLKNGQARSDQYYCDGAAFTDQVLAEAECAFELLTLGVLWRVHAGDALGLGATSASPSA